MKRIKRALAPALALGLVAGTAPVTHAQSKGAVPVRIDFRALTEEGAQVSDLKAEDISLKVNGKPRQIKSLSLFRTTSDFALPSSQLPAPYATNAVGMKRSGDSHPDRRAVVNLDGKPVGRVVRTLRKSP